MELRQLEYFVAVAEEANFTRAAQRIHVAQPAVSAQIARLEKELGQPLLDRSHRTVRLTAAGEAALPFAQAGVAGGAPTCARPSTRSPNSSAGRSRSARSPPTTSTWPRCWPRSTRAHPAVEITLGTDDSDALIDGVQSGRLDLAIASVGSERCPTGWPSRSPPTRHRGGGRRGRPLAPPIVGFVDGARHASADRAAGRHRHPAPSRRGVRRRERRRCGSRSRPAPRSNSPTSPSAGWESRSCRSRWLVPAGSASHCPSCRSCVDGWCWPGARRARSVRPRQRSGRPGPRARACRRACIE